MGHNDIINDYIAGAIGGIAGLIVGHPFDTTKVQLQTRQTSTPFKNTWHAIKSIHQSSQLKGFFRGLAFPVVSYGAVNSVFFGVYSGTLRLLKGNNATRKATCSEIYLAGCVGGFAELFVACPADVIKVVLQSQIKAIPAHSQYTSDVIQPRYFHGPTDCIRWLYQKHGVRGLYYGFNAMLIRDVPTFGLYTLIYEVVFHRLNHRDVANPNGVLAGLMAGGMAGVVAWTCALPMDVVKSLIQADIARTKFRSTSQCVRYIYRLRGLRGFFAGWTVCCLRAFPTNAVTFLFYEQSLRTLNARS